MGVFSISSHHGNNHGNSHTPSSPTTTTTTTTELYGNNFNSGSIPPPSYQPPNRKISVPVTFYSNNNQNPPNFEAANKRNLHEAEAASDRRNLFSNIKFPSFSSSSKAHGNHHTVSPIKVQVSPAEPTRNSNVTGIPSTVRITRRHTEHAGTLRKYTPPSMQHPQITFLQPPTMPSVSNYPEPLIISRPPTIAEESFEDMESGSPPGGAGIPSLPATHYRFKLPPLQVSNATLLSTNRVPDTMQIGSPPVKMMTSVSEPIRNKAASFASESPTRVSRYRVFFKCFFVVLFLSIPVVIFVVMMALSGGFSPFQTTTAASSNNNRTITNSSTLSPIVASATTMSSSLFTTTTTTPWTNNNNIDGLNNI